MYLKHTRRCQVFDNRISCIIDRLSAGTSETREKKISIFLSCSSLCSFISICSLSEFLSEPLMDLCNLFDDESKWLLVCSARMPLSFAVTNKMNECFLRTNGKDSSLQEQRDRQTESQERQSSLEKNVQEEEGLLTMKLDRFVDLDFEGYFGHGFPCVSL